MPWMEKAWMVDRATLVVLAWQSWRHWRGNNGGHDRARVLVMTGQPWTVVAGQQARALAEMLSNSCGR
eukprot:scaffold318343_cov21-Tisochrysis_lutea.AAC.1